MQFLFIHDIHSKTIGFCERLEILGKIENRKMYTNTNNFLQAFV